MSRAGRGALAKKLYSDAPIALQAVHPRKRRKSWWNLVVLASGALGIVTLVILVYLGLCSSVVQDQYAVDRYERILPQIREENENLKIEIKELSSFSRIDRIARNNLRMGPPLEQWMLESSPVDSPAGTRVAEETFSRKRGASAKVLVP